MGALARDLGLARQVLAINRGHGEPKLPKMTGLPETVVHVPALRSLADRQLLQASVLGLDEASDIDAVCAGLMAALA